MITNQFRIYLCHFHCSHWQNHLLNFMFREKGPLVLVKTPFFSLFWNKLMIPHANCNGHVPFDMFHHIRPQNDTLGFFGRKYLSEQHWQMRHIRPHGCNPSLANTTCPELANSVNPDQLASDPDLHCMSLNISIKNPDQVIWLAGN